MNLAEHRVYCADIGSVAKKCFGWGAAAGPNEVHESDDIEGLTTAVTRALAEGEKVALGFECPLFVPLPDDPKELTKARTGEGSRPWSAGAGCGALVTGLTETVWILSTIKEHLPAMVPAFLDWPKFRASHRGLFIWEAFVTGEAKAASHCSDAAAAVREFVRVSADLEGANAIKPKRVFSLVGAALLRSGWTHDLSVLSEPCIVIKPGKQVASSRVPDTQIQPPKFTKALRRGSRR
jgi:hypothetical protein